MAEAVIYTRVSSREQQQEGFSLDAQSRLLQEYAHRNGLLIVQAFEDVETARATGRKQFGKMVEFFKRNQSCRTLLVEKTDRISRNFRDAVTLEDLDIEVHFVREGQVISKESKSQAILVYGFNLVMARHYSNNLREEVKKGMREKAEQGIYPGHAPIGYRNNKAERTIEVDSVDSPVVTRIFALYATGCHSLTTLRKTIETETAKKISRSYLHFILKNRFYTGFFEWGGQTYPGKHPLFVDPSLFEQAQSILSGHNRPRYSTREIAFRGLMQCGYDGCAVTGEVQKEKYVYYRCSGSRGKCDLPWFREEEIVELLGESLRPLQLGREAISQIILSLRENRRQAVRNVKAERSRLESRLNQIRDWMDKAYNDKLAERIPEDFWERRMSAWRIEEQETRAKLKRLEGMDTRDRVIEIQKSLDLANKAYSLYASHDLLEKARLLRTLFLSCSIDARQVTPTYRRPFDMILRRAGQDEWLQYLIEV